MISIYRFNDYESNKERKEHKMTILATTIFKFLGYLCFNEFVKIESNFSFFKLIDYQIIPKCLWLVRAQFFYIN